MYVKTIKDVINGMQENAELQIRKDGNIIQIKNCGFTKENNKTILVFNI